MAAKKQLKDQSKAMLALGLARISLGFIFIWGFFDKLLGLGFSTCRDAATDQVTVMCSQAWVNGASPTSGFLQFATDGPMQGAYQAMAGNPLIDWLFMLGLLLIGAALILGIGVRVATVTGSLLMFMMWTSMLLPANNPLIDEHIIYILLLAVIYFANDEQRLGLGAWWSRQELVKKYPVLR